MFNLKTASIGIRKVAYLLGIREGKWQPEPNPETVATIVKQNGDAVEVMREDLDNFNDWSWREIKERGQGSLR